MGKTIVCHCEDITLGEIHTALAQGYGDIESLKRYTGIGTGKCQGKCCLVQTLRELGSAESVRAIARGQSEGPGEPLGISAAELSRDLIRIPTIRQPVLPATIDELARAAAAREERREE